MIDIDLLAPGEALDAEAEGIWKILCQVDAEFVPPLSARDSTTTKTLSGVVASATPVTYYRQVMGQHAFLARSSDGLVGLMSFIVGHHETLLADFSPCTYIPIVAVAPEFRRQGIAFALYREMLALQPPLRSPWIATRTWSDNESHISLLGKIGAQLVQTLHDHRAPGVDTVYYAKRVD